MIDLREYESQYGISNKEIWPVIKDGGFSQHIALL